MLLFSKRIKLEDMYYAWIKENGLKDCPFNVMSYLVGEGLIIEDKALEFIKNGGTNDKTEETHV